MHSSLPSLLAFALLMPFAATTQPPATFTGGWTMVAERSESPQQTPPIHALALDITQSDAELRVDMVRDGVPSTTTFAIGRASTAAGRAPAADAGTARAYWDGSRLVTERAGTVNGQTVSVKQIFGLNADASEMTVETLLVVQHGYTLRGAKNYGSKTDVFTRSR